MAVYLIHFDEKIGRPQDPAQREAHGLPPREHPYTPHAGHYVGYTDDLPRRLYEHRNGYSAGIMGAVHDRGIPCQLVRVWPDDGDKALERRIKDQHNTPRLCPICNPDSCYNHIPND